jgi:hypothetical protein
VCYFAFDDIESGVERVVVVIVEVVVVVVEVVEPSQDETLGDGLVSIGAGLKWSSVMCVFFSVALVVCADHRARRCVHSVGALQHRRDIP